MANTTASVGYFQTALQRYMLENISPYLVHEKFGQVKGLPSHKTKTVKFIRYNTLSPATTPLTEGVPDAGESISFTSFTAEVKQYGAHIELTDVLLATHEDDLWQVSSELLTQQAGESKDIIVREVLNSGTNVIYAGGAADRASVSAQISEAELKLARKILARNKAKYITSFVAPSQGYNTNPLPPAYVAIVHPDVVYSLQSLPGFKPVETYARPGNYMENEVGAWGNIRFVETTQAKVWAGAGLNGVDVYSILVMGKNAYGIVKHDAMAFETIIKRLSDGGVNDPLNQKASIGWKMMTAAVILNDDFLVRIEVAA